MTSIDKTLDTLRDAAEAGEAEAARELGRLLCLQPTLDEGDSVDDRWPGEMWLRIALSRKPEDTIAAGLLASRLVQQITAMLNGEESFDSDSEEEAVERRVEEARELYDAVLALDSSDPTAEAGLALLDEVLEGEQPDPSSIGYSYYLLENDAGHGSTGHLEQLVVTDPDELRWACGYWFERYGGLAGFTLATYVDGEQVNITDLGTVTLDDEDRPDWTSVDIPPLPGELLPAGHPVGPCHYGYTAQPVD
ncbi:hypothetical protein [Actinoalloteichus hymeniacidonis]|uniref:Uncharacterized protein n=1 Tax=Actinoalloteichus hymeniacidonis TaxID=340345 RepID=A0AAC9HKV7_9PSEU|nr:hypothetical protein [Actinoalloteichus hymeniacidonis]AOS61272.1 hypothetical protein TL08_02170 [Actinoalloteichus hymeniacidonis]MBB5910725.1 hypothetical protein [Actinoalloteichus hymeniacidonis]